jgi:uncharacterized OB-fold protein
VKICTQCLLGDTAAEATLAFEEVSGRGTIHSYTIIHDSRLEGFAPLVPYRVVEVELEEQPGLVLYANMPDLPEGPVPIGDPVEVTFVDGGEGVRLPEFRLRKA